MANPDSLPALHASPECDAELVPWRLAGGPRLTAVAKIAIALEAGELKKLAEREDLVHRDRHHDRSPMRSLEHAAELAPLLPGAEVVIVGHAYAPRGLATPTLAVQLQVARKGVVSLRKRIVVTGDRRDPRANPIPFQRMPLTWERAMRTEANPVGIDPNAAAPNLFNPDNPAVAACFAPISSLWSARRSRLGAVPRSVVESDSPDLPAGFDFNYYRAAPDDQQLQGLKGDEWLALDGMHPLLPRLEFKLPGVLVVARLVQPAGRPLKVQPLLPDRLVIDTDRQRATLTYRGAFAAEWTQLAGHRVEIGVSKQDETLRFPDHDDPSTLRGRSRVAAQAAPVSVGETVAVGHAVSDGSLPFAGAPAAAPRNEPPLVDRGLPFGANQPPPPAPPPNVPTPPPVVAKPPAILAPPERDPFMSTMMVDSVRARSAPVPFADAIEPGEPAAPATTRGLPFQRSSSNEEEEAQDTKKKPEREGEVVPTLADAPVMITAFPWQLQPPQDVLVIAVKATFDLVPNEPAQIREEPAMVHGDVFEGDDLDGPLDLASDFAILKPEVDVLLRGTAYAPGGKATAMRVSVRVRGEHGTVDRSIAVFGDRTWQGGALQVLPSNPEPFESMPITYARAFGGPELEVNPQGVGHRGGPSADGVRRLPNFEEISKLIKAPSDTPPPAGLGAVHPLSRARTALLGTYDPEWFKTRWPYFPRDFDFRYFQAAPAAQRLSRAVGNEEYELVGVHREHGTLKGRLPEVRPRLFAVRTDAAGGGMQEVPLRLDTITFAPDDNAVHLVWRGNIDVRDDDAPELARVFGTVEPLVGPPLSLDEVRARYLAALAGPPEVGLVVPEEAPQAPAAPTAEDAEDDATAKQIEDDLAAREAEIAALLPPPDADAPPPGPLPEPDPVAIAEAMREGGATEDEIAEIMEAFAPPTTEPPPAPAVDLRELVKKRIEDGEPLSGLELAGADLRDLDLSAQSLERTNLSGAKLDRANLTSADATGANLSGASLTHANLDQTLLVEADLTKADLTDAVVTGALLDRVEAGGLVAVRADFRRAMMSGAIMQEADLASAKLDDADLTEADLTSARLDRATFLRANMKSIRLYEATGVGASFDGATMTNARAEAAVLTESFFREVKCDDSVWERADLSKSTFLGASLRGSSFLKATCRATVFSGADITRGRLRKSRMVGAQFIKTNLMEATCDRAVFENADLRGANLHAASLLRTVLHNAKLDEANISYSDLDKRQPA